ncbi:methyltransferase domain-containing protein [Chelatococcus sp. GCM10030263]|uniref:methyltransferase domain-containing protein n=1 Tax=Chelatococcus sp. GCM10030263 TaxID=3273387 RepID=UPI00361CA671
MRMTHLRALAPVCPQCLAEQLHDTGCPEPRPLELEEGDGQAEEIECGLLRCLACNAGYPILAGLPVLVPDPARFIADHLVYFLLPADLPEALENWLGEALGGSGWHEAMRRHCSTYGWDHYGDCDPDEATCDAASRPGSAVRSLAVAFENLAAAPHGPVLDVGCGAGRASFALAEQVRGLVLGIDLNVPLLRLARQALHTGEVVYPRRDLGRAYARRRVPFSAACGRQVDFWIADAQQPPFTRGRFGALAALNMVDCLERPAEALAALRRVLADGGRAIISVPYDWAEAVTPVSEWIAGAGGSQSDETDAEAELRTKATAAGFRIVQEWPHQPWRLRLHRRASVTYDTHVLVLAPDETLDGAIP